MKLKKVQTKKINDLTKLASKICQTPIALVSFLTEDTQWIKSSIGLNEKEIKKEDSFCFLTIESKSPFFIVEDVFSNESLKNLPLVIKDPYVRFYAGTPLIAPNGDKIGTLSVMDHKPRKLTEDQLEALTIISGQIISELELQKTISHMIKQSKLTSLSEFGSSIAHEINNPLTIINGSLCLLRNYIPEEKMKHFSNCLNAVNRIATTVKVIRKFSSADITKHDEPLELKKITLDVLSLVDSKIKLLGIDLILDLNQLKIIGNEQDLSHAIMNLITNSIDALVKLDEPKKWIKITIKDRYFEIVDSGKGVCESIRKKLFIPFTTTKKEVTGVGLGLSISKGIIDQHLGKISYDLKDGNTCFRISF